VTVMLLRVGLTKKPRHPMRAEINTTVAAVTNNAFRLELEIIENPRELPQTISSGLPPIVAEEIFVLCTSKDMNQNTRFI
jgi:hypothetical protein